MQRFVRFSRNRVARTLSIAVLAVAGAAARAASYDYAESSDDHIAFNPGHFVFDTGGAWVAGNAAVRFGANGSVAFVAQVEPFGGDALLVETIDGGVVEADRGLPATPFTLPCSLQKLGANGARQWLVDVESGSACATLAADGDGTLWIAAQAPDAGSPLDLFRIDADGSGFAQVVFPAGFVPFAVSAAAGSGAYVAGYVVGATTASVVALDGNGIAAWQWTDTTSGALLTQVGLDAAGNIYASGYDSHQALAIVSLASSGSVRWDTRPAIPGVDRTSGFQVAGDGSSFALVPAQDRSHRVLAKVQADGTLAWQSDVPVENLGGYSSWLDGQMGLRLAPNGDLLVLADSGGNDPQLVTTTLVRFDADGHAGASTVLTGLPDASAVDTTAMIAMPDSSAMITTRSDFTAGGLATLGSPASDGLFLRIDSAGRPASNPFAAAEVPASVVFVDSTVAADGTTYLVTNNVLGNVADHSIGGVDSRYALSAISSSGARLWKVEANGYLQSARLIAGDGRVCIAGNLAQYWLVTWGTPTPPPGGMPALVVECHDTTNGAARWTTQLAPAGSAPATIGGTTIGDDGTIVVSDVPAFDAAPTETDVATLDASGAIAGSHTLEIEMLPVAMGPDGSTLLAFAPTTSDATIALLRPDGSTAYNGTLSGTAAVLLAEVFADESADVVALDASGDLVVKSISASGAVVSSAVLTTGTTTSTVAGISLANDASSAYVTLVFGAEESPFHGTKLFKIDRTTGAMAWQTTLDEPVLQAGVAIDPTGGALVLYTLSDHKAGTRGIDPATGAAGSPTYRACGNSPCTALAVHGARITADGALRYAIDNSGAAIFNATHPHVFGIDAIATVAPPIPVAQSGVAGAWYAPYESGQGFTLDYIASSGTLFIPWFTYTAAGGNEPSARAWYTLQGNASAGDTSADLTIFSSSGGAFASGTTSPVAVGTATLAFTDCSNGTLAYQFDSDVNGGATGTITITRLTTATADCTLADGSTQPAGSFADSNGFSTSQSGSWYDPTTSGQGIEFTIVPASGGASGTLFGAWFTYEPANNAPDSATRQQWFTLQGDLSTASAGSVSVPIFATLGGSFDDAPATTTTPIGQATITFSNCAATVDYHFDDSALAHAYRDLGGTLHLVRLGGCGG